MWFPKYLEIGINFNVRYLILIQLIYKCNVYSCKTYYNFVNNIQKFHCSFVRQKSFTKTLSISSIYELVAKRKACLQPEKTQGYQYLFAVQFFNSYVYRGRLVAGLDKVFENRDRHHRIRRQILRQNEGLILILAQR